MSLPPTKPHQKAHLFISGLVVAEPLQSPLVVSDILYYGYAVFRLAWLWKSSSAMHFRYPATFQTHSGDLNHQRNKVTKTRSKTIEEDNMQIKIEKLKINVYQKKIQSSQNIVQKVETLFWKNELQKSLKVNNRTKSIVQKLHRSNCKTGTRKHMSTCQV